MKKTLASICFVASCNAYATTASQSTSVDLYCDTLLTATSETRERLRGKPPKEKSKKIEELNAEILRLCKSTPATGESKLISKMTPQEITLVSCLAMAEGITNAYIPDQEPYTKLRERREFYGNACITNSKAFLNDIYKYGPDYAMTRKY